MKKVALAYSGGLDTSFCIQYLSQDQNCEVHALTVNTGGFSQQELHEMEQRAYALGAKSFQVVDAVQTYYDQCIRFLLYGNVLRNQTYPLSVSAERAFQAMEVARFANGIKADAVAHGSTGAGNDQVRFDLAFLILGQNLEIISPIRDLQLSREAEVKYLQERGFDFNWEKAKYSINQGLWGTSVGGVETLTSHQSLPEEAWPSQLSQEKEMTVNILFEKGQPVGLNDEKYGHPTELIKALQQLAASYAIGRDTHVGDTIIGIKGRVGFEAAAPMILIKAHQLLEKHVLTKWQQYWKEQLGNWYGMLLHEGQFLDPVMRNIEVFLEDTQQSVSGSVEVRLLPYRFELIGIKSPYDLMQSRFGSYGEMNLAWTGEEAKGFIKIMANQNRIYQSVQQVANKKEEVL